MSSSGKDRYSGYSTVSKSRRTSQGDPQPAGLFSTGQGGRTILPPLSDSFPTSRFPVPTTTYSNPYQPRSAPNSCPTTSILKPVTEPSCLRQYPLQSQYFPTVSIRRIILLYLVPSIQMPVPRFFALRPRERITQLAHFLPSAVKKSVDVFAILCFCPYLGLPYLYVSAIMHVVEKATSLLEAISRSVQDRHNDVTLWAILQNLDNLSPLPLPVQGYEDLRTTWFDFVDNRVAEWTVIMTFAGLIFAGGIAFSQVDNVFVNPFMRITIQLSAFCALMAVANSAAYYFRFKTIRRAVMSIEWACDAARLCKNPFWKISVILSLPAVWLVWALFISVISILYYGVVPISSDAGAYETSSWATFNMIGRGLLVIVFFLALIQEVAVYLTFRRWAYDKFVAQETPLENLGVSLPASQVSLRGSR